MWATWLAEDWKKEHPIKVHGVGLSADGTPAWHPDFAHWLNRERKPKRGFEDYYHTSRAMKKLQRSSIRAYEVCYRILLHGETVDDTTAWLNERARRNRIPPPDHRPDGPHYTARDTYALLISGIDYAKAVW